MVAVIVDVPGGNEQFYGQIAANLFPDGELPDGWLVHTAGATESGWRIVNVVPSQEQFKAFARERLRTALQQLEGVTPYLTSFPVHKLIRQGASS
jgi:hypothetical protein